MHYIPRIVVIDICLQHMCDNMLVAIAFYYSLIPYPGEINPQDIGKVNRYAGFVDSTAAFVLIVYVTDIIFFVCSLCIVIE